MAKTKEDFVKEMEDPKYLTKEVWVPYYYEAMQNLNMFDGTNECEWDLFLEDKILFPELDNYESVTITVTPEGIKGVLGMSPVSFDDYDDDDEFDTDLEDSWDYEDEDEEDEEDEDDLEEKHRR